MEVASSGAPPPAPRKLCRPAANQFGTVQAVQHSTVTFFFSIWSTSRERNMSSALNSLYATKLVRAFAQSRVFSRPLLQFF